MRQLFIVHGPVFGGGQGQFARLRAPMARRGWELVGCVPAGSEAGRRLRAEGVEVHELPLHRLRAVADPRPHLALAATFGLEVQALRRLLREQAIDLLQAHGDTNPHGALAAHADDRAVVWQLYDTRTPALLRRLTMPLVTRVADVITTWGDELARLHPGATGLGARCVPVFPPVDAARFAAAGAAVRAAARAELGVPDGALAIGAVGMRNPSKGYEFLVRALARLRRERPDAVGRVLGPPSPAHAAWEAGWTGEAAALGLDATAFSVRDAGRRVPELLPGLDVLALTSVPRSEGMPTVILEAMACGLPVVATDVGAVRELVADGETGFVVPPLDDAAIAAALARLANPELRHRLGAAGRARFERDFSLDALADRHVRAYELALEHRAGRARRRRLRRRPTTPAPSAQR